MKLYSCGIIYNYNEIELEKLFFMALKNLGFEPKYMDLHYDAIELEQPLSNVPYNEKQIYQFLQKKSGTITIKKTTDREDARIDDLDAPYYSFGMSYDKSVYNITKLGWSNPNLDFLMPNINGFFESKDFRCCYCADQYDYMNQSNQRIEYFVPDYPGEKYKTIKGVLGDKVIDTSERWGRREMVNGMVFMAAPLMWFGKAFYSIIPKERLTKFKNASYNDNPSFPLVSVRLFDLYDLPSKEVNRKKQKEFWDFFDLRKVIKNYQQDNTVDLQKWIDNLALQAKKKGKGAK